MKKIKKQEKAGKNFAELKPEVRLRELASLQEMLKRPGPITPKRIEKWVREVDVRVRLLSGSVWGAIQWSKSIGKPKAPSILDGFLIKHDYLAEKFRIGPGGVEDISTWESKPAPSVWDMSSGENYRVAFHFFAEYFWPNRLTLALKDGVQWERPLGLFPGYYELEPRGFPPFRNLGEVVVLPDVEVVHVPRINVRTLEEMGKLPGFGRRKSKG